MTGILAAVDDSPSMQQMVSCALENADYDVMKANDGNLALEFAGIARVSLVTADRNIPNMDGFTLVTKPPGLPDYRLVPVLILTTESSCKKKMQGRDAGGTGRIVIPVGPDQPIDTLQWVLD